MAFQPGSGRFVVHAVWKASWGKGKGCRAGDVFMVAKAWVLKWYDTMAFLLTRPYFS